MNKNKTIDLDNLDVDELRAITENAQQLIAKKQHQRLYDAYMQFEKIAEESNSTIEEILKAGEKLEKNAVLNIAILTIVKRLGQAVVVSPLGWLKR